MDGVTFLKNALSIDAEFTVVMLTGHGDISTAVESMRLGAYDFIEKPFSNEYILDVLKRAGEKRALVLENRALKDELDAQTGAGPRLLGNTQKIKALRRLLMQIKDIPADVLIRGETGSGKDLVARFLHYNSHRRNENFVAINCGAIPETMIESELFGFEAGAFTSAQKKRIGKIEHANGGTFFLDEIESMPMALQIKLLRVLEDRVIEPLGSNRSVDLDIRVIAAAKIDLLELVDKGEIYSTD
jgi:two-component system C4-dicarboxylate transport response regulator DctD